MGGDAIVLWISQWLHCERCGLLGVTWLCLVISWHVVAVAIVAERAGDREVLGVVRVLTSWQGQVYLPGKCPSLILAGVCRFS